MKPAHLRRALAVEVDQVAPGVAARLEVRPELRQVVPRRPEVVVDHVLDDAEAGLVAAVDEPLVAGRAAVRLVDRVPQHAVVAPVVDAVHRVDRHQLDEVDAERAQVVEPPERRVERPLRGEGPDVELVDHRAAPAADRSRPGRASRRPWGRRFASAGGRPPADAATAGRVGACPSRRSGSRSRPPRECREPGPRGPTSRRPRASSRRWHRPPTAGPVAHAAPTRRTEICGELASSVLLHQQRDRQVARARRRGERSTDPVGQHVAPGARRAPASVSPQPPRRAEPDRQPGDDGDRAAAVEGQHVVGGRAGAPARRRTT